MAGSSSGGSGLDRGESSVFNFSKRRGSCGYCKSGVSISYGFWATSLSVDDYQELLDQGWRRCGCYLYKPDMEKTCCPSYTIRLKAHDHVPSKEQLRVCRRMKRFEDGAFDGRKQTKSNASAIEVSMTGEEMNHEEQFMFHLSEKLDTIVRSHWYFLHNIQFPKACVRRVAESKRKLLVKGSENLLFTSNIAFQIAAALKRSQTNESNDNFENLSSELIAMKLVASLNQVDEKSDISIRACKGHINIYSAQKQFPVSEGKRESFVKKSSTHGYPNEKRRNLEIHIKRSSFDPEEYDLYRKYQIKVHNDAPHHVTEASYNRFLVDTPLIYVLPSIDDGDGSVPVCGLGSFHQQYVIDGRIIAVAVIDILPKCLSSKYFFWDPDFAFLSLGKYSAIQEISWIKENQATCRSLEYYYLGYYIHSCNKMRYKAAYHPSQLLCPLRYQWVDYDIAKPLLDSKPYVVLSDFLTSQNVSSLPPYSHEKTLIDEHLPEPDLHEFEFDDSNSEIWDDEIEIESPTETQNVDVGDVLIGLHHSEHRVRFKELREMFGAEQRAYFEHHLRSYVRVVGADLSKRIVYFPS